MLGELGWIALQQGDAERAEELCSEALAVARETGDAATISGQLNYLADVFSARGDHSHALAAHEEALALRRTLDDPLLVANSTYNLGIAAFENGEIDRARAAFEEAHDARARLGDVLHPTAADFMLAELDLHAGDPDEAERRILGLPRGLHRARERLAAARNASWSSAAAQPRENGTRTPPGCSARRAGSAAMRPPNRFERPVLDRFLPELVDRLGEREAGRARSRGRADRRRGADGAGCTGDACGLVLP